MGGIAGIHSQKIDQNEKHKLITTMLSTICHRGKYAWMNGFSSMFFSVGGRYHAYGGDFKAQALDAEENIMVAMDGDILHYTDDKSSLCETYGDAQLVLQLYKKHGKDCVDKIDGAYSISIWDGKKRELILIRDRMGAKPIFYAKKNNDTIVFASEIKAIIATGLIEKRVHLDSMDNFLSYWYVPCPNTMFQSIFQVRPGHMMVFKESSVEEKRYWKFEYHHEAEEQSEEFYCAQFYDIFLKAVSRCLKKYPDAGAFLSGGMDSSSVVAAMSKIRPTPFKVFSGGFKEKEYNEIDDAKVVSDHLGLSHYSTIIEFGDDFSDLIEKLVWLHDGPFSDTSAIPSYFASKLAKSEVDVVLTGDLPDQILGGSGHYMKALDHRENDSHLSFLFRNKFVNKIIRKFPISSGASSLNDKIKRKLYRETFPIEMQRIICNMPVSELMKPCLYSSDMMEINRKNNPLSYAESLYREVSGYDMIDRMLYFDTHSYAPDDLMVKVDRMTMAHGLVAISPFHDRELVEFVATLPVSMKIKGREGKYILKKAMGNILPEQTLKKKKKGFDMPIDQWLIQKNPRYVKELLLDDRTTSRGYFNKKFLELLVNNYLDQKTDYASGSSATIISLMTLEFFHRTFIDGDGCCTFGCVPPFT